MLLPVGEGFEESRDQRELGYHGIELGRNSQRFQLDELEMDDCAGELTDSTED